MNKDKKTPKAEKTGIKDFLKRRSTRRGAAAVTLTVLFIAAVVLLNIVLSAVTDRFPLYLDVTENSAYRLQEDTKDYLSGIEDHVDIYVLEKETDFEGSNSTNYKYTVQANRLMHSIAECSGNIDLHYIDLEAQPTFVSSYPQVDWTKSHAVLVVCGEQYRAVDFTDLFSYDQEQYYYYGTTVINKQNVEQAITTAILNVSAKDKTKVTVLSGQGEQDMTPFTTLLENNAYEIEEVSLLTGSISDESEFVVIYDPNVDIDESIYDTLTKWLDNNGEYGHHLVYFPNDQHETKEYPNLNRLLADYGMEVEYGYIYEDDENYIVPGYNHYLSVFDYGDDSAYTDGLRNPSIPIVMMMTMPITVTDDSMAKPLLTSSEKSFIFPLDITEEEVENFEPERQALNGAAIGQHNDGTEGGKSSSVAVIGSYEAVTTNYLSISSYNNAEYFVNLFNTLSENDHVDVVIEGKDPSAQSLGVTSVGSILIPSILVRFIIPIGVLVIGLITWIRRRHK